MVIGPTFRGLMAPVFTPYDSKYTVNISQISKYAEYLSKKNVKAVLVGGTVGEGVLMSQEERKKLTESWVNAAKTTAQHVMVHVGGTNLLNVEQLAKHAENCGASSLLCLPDLFFRPNTVKELVHYLKMVCAAAPSTPLFYYHFPALTGVNLDMTEFLEVSRKEIPTLRGLKYTHNNLEEAIRCAKMHSRAFTIYLGSDQLLLGAFCVGLDSAIATTLNFAADEIQDMIDKIQIRNLSEARHIQGRITNLGTYIIKEMQWINACKYIFSAISLVDVGEPRPPLLPLTYEQKKNLDFFLIQNEWIKKNI